MRDHRTLRLAQLEITAARVEALLKYQRTVAKHLAEPGHDGWAGHLAFAHAAGLKDSGLDAQDARKLSAVAADFCGRRWQHKRLEARLAEATTAGKPSKKDGDLLSRIPKELKRLADFSVFSGLHGEKALEHLRAREAELLDLHEKLAALEGEGHLHRG